MSNLEYFDRFAREAEEIVDALPSGELSADDEELVKMARRGAYQIVKFAGVEVGRFPDHEAWYFAQTVLRYGFASAAALHRGEVDLDDLLDEWDVSEEPLRDVPAPVTAATASPRISDGYGEVIKVDFGSAEQLGLGV